MLGHLGRFACVAVDLLADDAGCDVVEVEHEGGVELLQLGPQNLIDEALGNPDHHRGHSLAVQPIGPQPIAAAKGEEESARPLIGEGASSGQPS